MIHTQLIATAVTNYLEHFNFRMDLEITFPYKSDLTIPVLSEKLKSTPADSTVTITNVPKSEEGKLKLNMTLSGFLKVQVNDGSVTAQTPKV